MIFPPKILGVASGSSSRYTVDMAIAEIATTTRRIKKMNFRDALAALIDEQHAQRANYAHLSNAERSRDYTILGSAQIRVAYEVFSEFAATLQLAKLPEASYGTFDNCREYGMTVVAGDWTFCVYEHRNSDQIHLNGCPTALMESYGPYRGDKWDTLASVDPGDSYSMARLLKVAYDSALDGTSYEKLASELRYEKQLLADSM